MVSFECLPVEVILRCVFPYVHPIELWRFRRVNRNWCGMVATYFAAIKSLDFNDGMSEYYLTSEGLGAIVESLQLLQELFLDRCHHVVEESTLIAMATYCPRLEVLSLSCCRGVSDEAVRVIAEKCPHIKHFNLRRCFQHWVYYSTSIRNRRGWVSDAGLMHIAEHSKQLQELSVGRCYGVTDRGVAALIQGCPLLTNLDITSCYKVTDSSLMLLPRHAPRLKVLGIHGCSQVSDATIYQLCAAGIVVNNMSPAGTDYQ